MREWKKVLTEFDAEGSHLHNVLQIVNNSLFLCGSFLLLKQYLAFKNSFQRSRDTAVVVTPQCFSSHSLEGKKQANASLNPE